MSLEFPDDNPLFRLDGETPLLNMKDEWLLEDAVGAEDELRQASRVVGALVKAIKAIRYYPADYPIIDALRGDLANRLNVYLSNFYTLILRISETDFSVKDQVVYSTKDLKASIPFLFYRDGIRELRFIEGFDEQEMAGLIEVINQCGATASTEDDIVTLLWEKEFVHLDYLAVDDFLENVPITIPENPEQFREHLLTDPPGHEVEASIWDLAEGGVDFEALWQQETAKLPRLPNDRRLYTLTPDESRALVDDVNAELAPEAIWGLSGLLFDLLAQGHDVEAMRVSIEVLKGLINGMLAQGEIVRARELLAKVQGIIHNLDTYESLARLLKPLVIAACSDENITLVGKLLQTNEERLLQEVKFFLLLLPHEAVPPLIRVLGKTEHAEARTVICDVLMEIGKNALELMVPFLSDSRGRLVRDLTRLIGTLGQEKAVPYLAAALRHQDHGVRVEALTAIAGCAGTQAERLLIKALADPDKDIRCLAAISLGRRNEPGGIAALLQAIRDKSFHGKPAGEMKAFLDGLGMSRSNSALEVLEELLLHRSWFSRGRDEALHIGAARALALVGTPEARAILDNGKKSKDASIRFACVQAAKYVHR
ncbi:MAG: HEAT repeat domain-containing protein [Armatimonadota bacterium]